MTPAWSLSPCGWPGLLLWLSFSLFCEWSLRNRQQNCKYVFGNNRLEMLLFNNLWFWVTGDESTWCSFSFCPSFLLYLNFSEEGQKPFIIWSSVCSVNCFCVFPLKVELPVSCPESLPQWRLFTHNHKWTTVGRKEESWYAQHKHHSVKLSRIHKCRSHFYQQRLIIYLCVITRSAIIRR